jgi:hypothetical protein
MKRWTADKLTTEQAIGQLIQQLQQLSDRVGEVERRLEAARPRGEGSKPER